MNKAIRYGSVFGFVLGAVLAIGVFIDSGESEAVQTTPVELVDVDSYMKRPAVNAAPVDNTIYVDEVVIAAQAPSHPMKQVRKEEKSKTWVCSEWRESLVGGRVRECGWK